MEKSLLTLTPEHEAQLLGYIRAGGFPHVAAEAAGIPKEVFTSWLECGSGPEAQEPYQSFALRVKQALAHARLRAELEIWEKAPLNWLRYGPGRETPQSPGWTGQVKPVLAEQENPEEWLADPEIAKIWQAIVESLEKFPEARLAVAEVFKKMKKEPAQK